MRKELTALKDRGTWTEVPIPEGVKLIGNHVVHDLKLDELNRVKDVDGYKCRLVARGDQCREGIDYTETKAQVAHTKSFRILMCRSVEKGSSCYAIDVSNAFLYSKLDKPVYMRYPPGFKGKPGHCLRLEMGLYGLPNASFLWEGNLGKTNKEFGLIRCQADHSVWRHPTKDFIVSIHVDDILICTPDEALYRQYVKHLQGKYKIKVLGLVRQYLGMDIIYGEGWVEIHQKAYIERMLERFNQSDSKPARTPMAGGQILTKRTDADEDESEMANVPYRALVGSLLYAALGTRPDIAYAVRACAQHAENPTRTHWKAALRILKYLGGTKDHGLKYHSKGNTQPVCYTDSDWGQHTDHRRSISGFVWLQNGAPVNWQSKTQRNIALSSCEAEFIALGEAVREVRWMKIFAGELKLDWKFPVTVYVDNQAAIALAKNPVSHQRNKHIDIIYLSLREQVELKVVNVIYIQTGENLADLFTKATGFQIFQKLILQLIRK